MRILIPARVELAPAAGEDNVESVLVPPENVLAVGTQAVEHLLGVLFPAPLVDVCDQQPAVEVSGLRREAQLAIVCDWRDRVKV